MPASAIALAFQRRWEQNNSGVWRGRAARWRVLHWMLLQSLGLKVWARARLFFGPSMCVLTGEAVSGGILAFGYAETALTALMLKTVKPGMTFVDIGAHFGYEATLAAALVGREGHVISFEPQPKVAVVARRNLARFPQVRFVEAAVGEQDGTLELEDRSLTESAFTGRMVEGHSIAVPMVRLATALHAAERPVHVLKCDVEGGEMFVLSGALELLRQDQPLLILEAEMPDNESRPRIREFEALLNPLGYEAMLFEFDGALRIGRLGELTTHHANVAFVPSRMLPIVSSDART